MDVIIFFSLSPSVSEAFLTQNVSRSIDSERGSV